MYCLINLSQCGIPEPMHKLEYTIDDKGNIVLPPGKPFDGSNVLVRTTTGWVQAYWVPYESSRYPHNNDEGSGWFWCCYDDAFELDLDEVIEWIEMPN